jgi:hypothetical protein
VKNVVDFDLASIQSAEAVGLDSLFEREAHLLSPFKGRSKVASLRALHPFLRLSAETLVHKSDRDLWALLKEGNEYFIQRLFDDTGEPLKF